MVTDISKLISEISTILSVLDKEQFNCKHECKLLVKSLLNITDVDVLLGGTIISVSDYDKIITLAHKRASGYPLQYLLGEWEFYGLAFNVGEGVLVPRADTECLCDVVMDLSPRDLTIVDLCSGSGCIAITIEHFHPSNHFYAIEKSTDAFGYLQSNISLHKSNVNAINEDIFNLNQLDKLKDIDIIVSNPPYLTDTDMSVLQKEVSFEPALALHAEENGLYFYKYITSMWKSKLKNGGMLSFEIGAGQHDAVMQILSENNFYNIRTKQDLCGIIRVVYGTYSTEPLNNRTTEQ